MSVIAPERQSASWTQRALDAMRTSRGAEVLGAVVAFAAAVGLFSRFSINGRLSRDEGIYSYGGQQMVHGVPPYSSIFDPKGPGATMIAGFAAEMGHLIGRNELKLIRLVFFVCAVMSVVAIYFLVLQLWHSVVAALAAAVVFASFKGFAEDALAGPDAKTPGVLFVIIAMWFAARRQWLWSAVFGSLATLVWQPFGVYPLVALLGAVLCSAGRRWAALGWAFLGAVAPFVVVGAYFAAEGALGRFFEAAFQFPAEGVRRGRETVGQRIRHIAEVVHQFYATRGAIMFWVGLALVVVLALARVAGAGRRWRPALLDPIVLVVLLTMLGEIAYAASDFQSYPDLYPLLPYGAIGIGGALALALRWLRQPVALRVGAVAGLAAAAVLAGVTWQWFTNSPQNEHGLLEQRAMACALDRVLVPGSALYALGDPRPLVLTERRNPDRFIYLGSGVDQWKVDHTKGGFDGWTAQVRDSGASVVVMQSWYDTLHARMRDWLRASGYYRPGYLGQWRVFLTPAALAQAGAAGIEITHFPTKLPRRAGGGRFDPPGCSGTS